MIPGDSGDPGVEVGIVLLTLNQREKTLRCMKSLAQVVRPSHRIVLWDNGSTDGTSEAVRREFPSALVHHHPTNEGVAGGRNAAVELLRSEHDPLYLLFLDNDMTIEPEFLERLVQPFSEDPDLAQTTAKIRDMADPQRLYGAGGCRLRFWLGDTTHNGYGEPDRGQFDHIRDCLPSGGCMLVRSTVFDELGGFSTIFDPYGPEDLDFGLRAAAAGYRARFVPEAIVYHETSPGRTFEGGDYTADFATKRVENWFKFMRRHASLAQKASFFLVGVPYLLFGFVRRQARRGQLFASAKNLTTGIFRFLAKDGSKE